MKACRIHEFGGPEVIRIEDVPTPKPASGEVLVRVRAAGVAPWDAWIRAGKSKLPQPLPLTLGSDLSGVVEAIGPDVSGFVAGDEIFGVTNARFTDANAEYAIAAADMIAKRPRALDWLEAASAPVVAVTAWQMLFDHGALEAGQTVVIHGGAGNVGAYAVQLAKAHGAHVIATGRASQIEEMKRLGADEAVTGIEKRSRDVDLVIDTLGANVHAASFAVLRPDGLLVSAVEEPDAAAAKAHGVRAKFIMVDVRTPVLEKIAERLDAKRLSSHVGEILTLDRIVEAHEMLDGKRPHQGGKIVLRVE